MPKRVTPSPAARLPAAVTPSSSRPANTDSSTEIEQIETVSTVPTLSGELETFVHKGGSHITCLAKLYDAKTDAQGNTVFHVIAAFANVLPKQRRDMGAFMEKAARDLFQQVKHAFPTPTLCIDVGTVWRRYLLITAVEGRHVVVVKAKSQEEMRDKRMTIESIRETVFDSIEELRSMGVYPVAIVADNCANVQGIAGRRPRGAPRAQPDAAGEEVLYVDPFAAEEEAESSESDDSLSTDIGEEEDPAPAVDQAALENLLRQIVAEDMLFVTKCAAHGLQLIVKDTQSRWADAFDRAREYRDQNPHLKIPRHMDPKWNSQFQLILRVLERGAPQYARPNREAGPPRSALGQQLPTSIAHASTGVRRGQHVQSHSAPACLELHRVR